MCSLIAFWRLVRLVCLAVEDDDGDARVKTDCARERSGYFMYCGSPILSVAMGDRGDDEVPKPTEAQARERKLKDAAKTLCSRRR